MDWEEILKTKLIYETREYIINSIIDNHLLDNEFYITNEYHKGSFIDTFEKILYSKDNFYIYKININKDIVYFSKKTMYNKIVTEWEIEILNEEIFKQIENFDYFMSLLKWNQ